MGHHRCRSVTSAISKGVALAFVMAGLWLASASTAAAAPPQIVSTYVAANSISATGVNLVSVINPNGLVTNYRFEYLTLAAYEGNLSTRPPGEAFAGASIPSVRGTGGAGGGTSPNTVSAELKGLAPETPYRYRVVATNSDAESTFSIARPFATQPPTNAFELLDHRGWEMVSPIEKDGGSIQVPGAISGGGIFQASAQGGSFTYSSANSFGEGAQSAPSGSQYLATRAATGWASANITTPLLAGSYGSEPDGVPYQLFSGDLGYGLLSNGERCRGQAGGECPVVNPPLPGAGAPSGYRDYYRRSPSGGFESILTAADLSHTSLGPDQFELRFVAATPDLSHVVLSSCAALTAGATEVAAPGGCDEEEQNLYEWSGGSLSLVNGLPGEAIGSLTGAKIASSSGAISSSGARVYFTAGGNVYLDEGGETVTVSTTPGAEFEAASADGSVAYLVVAGALERYSVATGNLTPVAAGPGVEGVLGVSADGSTVYYAEGGAVFVDTGGAVTEVAASAIETDWPAATGTARVSADGSRLLFLSAGELTGYPNEGETEVFLYGPRPGGGPAQLACVSCNPSGERPQGAAAIPGARPNGSGAEAFDSYKPRALSADGNRVFFETADSLVSQDINQGVTDVYEWEAQGEGTCARAGGCVQLISGGRDLVPSYFLDADAEGGEAFFLTAASLYPPDPGSYDVYVAREGGGFAIPESPIPCVADSCQVLPEAPEDPTPGTLVVTSGNPPLPAPGGGTEKKTKKPKKKKKHQKKKHQKKKVGHTKANGKAGGKKK